MSQRNEAWCGSRARLHFGPIIKIYLLDASISEGFQLNFSRASPTMGTIYKAVTDPVLDLPGGRSGGSERVGY